MASDSLALSGLQIWTPGLLSNLRQWFLEATTGRKFSLSSMGGQMVAKLRQSIHLEQLSCISRYFQKRYPKDNMNDEKPKPETTHSPEAPIRSTVLSSIKKPIGTKKTGGKTGGLGVKKLTTKPNESLYDQRPEEPAPAATSLAKSKITDVPSFPSQFEYVENTAIDNNAGGAQVIEHVAPPKSLSFFAEFGVDSGFQKKLSSTSSKESNEARQKFSNVKSISSAQFFGENKTSSENETHRTLQRFTVSASEDLSSLTNIAGETRKKLTSIASSLIYDLQDRIL
ncbi:probable ADP-ribosylation factor GTPase-activating protein AGD8 isoform X2 [Zingiber officinale]|uniref:probable ADP-ribosylation factor GTPase-activating protein AGD8 isoform X2 n=1 Tax=Zingiber officinale TaxID=94328 RepID=UPI001C4CBFDC|nr:probable ADP-ribosylation factor GTPase-activating protein AGD8 isoform X2 [Zingiber officinale]